MLCVTKKIATPLDRIMRITCSSLSERVLGRASKRRWASSKKKASVGSLASPTSGSFSKSSESIQSMKLEYKSGLAISRLAWRIWIMPRPSVPLTKKSSSSKVGSPKKGSAPSSSKRSKRRMMEVMEDGATLP